MSAVLHLNNKQFEIAAGSSLFEYAETVGMRVPTSCIKQGKCKECLVEVVEGMEYLSPKTEKENHLREKFRLACQCKVVADNVLIRCSTMHRGNMKIETGSLNVPALHKKLKLDPAVTRDGDRILLDGKEIARSDEPIYGIAMDLGTTTVVLRLINLENGKIVASNSFENPQRFGGSDIMARIHYDTEHRGKLLQRTLAGYITHAIEDFPVDPQTIYEMVVAGNSTMRDIFFRLNVYSIGQSPYRSITEIEMDENKRTTTSVTAITKRLRLPIHPKARIYGLPIISGHVGADAAACMLAIDIADKDKLVALMDIGTNTELILGNKYKILAASCPAGPAFEGGRISNGMPGLPGAIEKVKINHNGSVDILVIGGGTPEGICGSGLIDVLSELLKTGKMNNLGRLEDEEDNFVLYTGDDFQIYVTEGDINELAQAKGANVAGLHTVFNSYGIHFNDIQSFYLAGGFGRYLDIDSSKRIGLIPNINSDKIIQIGNASIEGASIALLSMSKRNELEELVKKVIHCRLETHPLFFEYFVEGCQFNPVESISDQSVKEHEYKIQSELET